MKRFIVLLLCAGLAAPGCASTQSPRIQTAPQPVSYASAQAAVPVTSSGEVFADFVRRLPTGARIRARTDERSVRGTLMKVTDRSLIMQPHARISEPLVEIPFTDVRAIEVDNEKSSAGRSIGIGIAAGAGAAGAVLLILAAIFAGS